MFWLRVLVPLLAIGYMLTAIPLRDVLAAARSISADTLALVSGLMLLSLLVATARWRALLVACGASAPPRFRALLRAYMIGSFYNTYLPGALGGDFLRALSTRTLVGSGGLNAALAVVMFERVLGFAAMLGVLATTFSLFPLPAIGGVMTWVGAGSCVAAVAVTALAGGRRLAAYAPAPLARFVRSWPQIESLPLFGCALGLSVLTQLLGVAIGHVVIAGIASNVRVTESLVILPLANAMQFFPLTIGGAGVREAAYVVLYASVGVPKACALAASLLVGMLAYAFSALGGIWHALQPLTLEPRPADAGPVAPGHVETTDSGGQL